MGGNSGRVLATLYDSVGPDGLIPDPHQLGWVGPPWAGTTLKASSSTSFIGEVIDLPFPRGRCGSSKAGCWTSFLDGKPAAEGGAGGAAAEAGAAEAGEHAVPHPPTASEGAVPSTGANTAGHGKPEEALDETRLQLRTLTKTSDEDLKNEIEEMEKQRNKAFLRGDPMADFEEVDTIGTKAHQLMVAGDYDDGPPYPITGFASPKWMRQGGEATNNEWVVKKNTKLGSGKSYPRVTCWIGAKEHPCKPCSEEEEEATKDMVEAEKEVESEVAKQYVKESRQ